MTVNVTNTHSFQLICPTTDSCSDMTVNLRFDDIGGDRNNSGVIYCVDQSSCDNLYFRTNSHLSQLFMYKQSDQVIMDNGAGFLSHSENILCITDDWIRFDGFLETEVTVMDSIAEYYPDDDAFPCSDVKVLCGNETISKSCSMAHDLNIDPISDLFDDNEDVCTLINVQSLNFVSCHGDCPSSPSLAPTNAPSDSPSTEPTNDPTYDPTADPTRIPTREPTMKPTSDPTTEPTTNPTDAPSQSPTLTPVASNEYDYYFEMEFNLHGLRDDEVNNIADAVHNFSVQMAAIIESGFDADDTVEYRLVEVNVTALNGEALESLIQKDPAQIALDFKSSDPLTVSSVTKCASWTCDYIIGTEFDIASCEQFVTLKTRNYFDSELFGVNVNADGEASVVSVSVGDYSTDAMELDPVEIDENKDYVYYGLMGVSGMIASIGVFALIYQNGNKLGFQAKVDTSRWIAFIILGLQFWDFASDVSLSFELVFHPDLLNDDRHGRLILVAAIGSTAFIVIPYASNLWIAAHIRRFVRNHNALTWFATSAHLLR